MPIGIEIYGPSGELWATTSDYLGKFIGTVQWTLGSSITYVNAPNFSGAPLPFVVAINPSWTTHTETVQGGTGASVTLHGPLSFRCTPDAPNNRINVNGPFDYTPGTGTVMYGSR